MRLVLIDISGFCHRIFHKSEMYFDNSDNPVGMVVGIFDRFFKAFCQKSWATHVVFCFDHPTPSFRNTLYPEYKGNRGERDEFYDIQYEILRQTLSSLGLCCVQKAGYEADDLIASLVSLGKPLFSKICVVSYDKDLLQLVDDSQDVYVLNPLGSKVFREKDVFEKLGVKTSQVVDYLAMCGDFADNIPGLKGYGEKNVRKILSQVETLENFLKCPDIAEKPSLVKSAYEHKEDVLLFKRLISLDASVYSSFVWNEALYDGVKILKWYEGWRPYLNHV